MAIQLKNTADVHTNGIKALVYGSAGAGKTTLAASMPNPIIISAEGGLLSIQGAGLPYIEVNSMETLQESFEYVASSDFESVVLLLAQGTQGGRQGREKTQRKDRSTHVMTERNHTHSVRQCERKCVCE